MRDAILAQRFHQPVRQACHRIDHPGTAGQWADLADHELEQVRRWQDRQKRIAGFGIANLEQRRQVRQQVAVCQHHRPWLLCAPGGERQQGHVAASRGCFTQRLATGSQQFVRGETKLDAAHCWQLGMGIPPPDQAARPGVSCDGGHHLRRHALHHRHGHQPRVHDGKQRRRPFRPRLEAKQHAVPLGQAGVGEPGGPALDAPPKLAVRQGGSAGVARLAKRAAIAVALGQAGDQPRQRFRFTDKFHRSISATP